MQDSFGNTVTVHGQNSLNAINAFAEGFVACEARAADVLAASDDESPLVQAYCAAIHLFEESRHAVDKARPFIDRLARNRTQMNPRETGFAAAIVSWAKNDIARAIARHQSDARNFPRDLVSIKLGQYHCFNVGDANGMLRLALAAKRAAPEIPYVHGMAAFGFEQLHMMREAEESARHAIEMLRKEPWAHHALGHVMLTEGRMGEGLEFMRGVSGTWVGLNSFMVTHNWWHLALFLIELDRGQEALEVYDKQVWGVVKDYSQDQIGAVSLLARLELAGVDVGDRWQDVANYLQMRVGEHVLPFLDLQYFYGLTRAARPEAATLLRNMETFAREEAGIAISDTWRGVCVPAARGLDAYAKGNHAAAADQLAEVLPRLGRIGGSHAQRDLFDQLYIDALIRTGTRNSLQRALDILQPRADKMPESLRLRRQASAVAQALADPASPAA